MLPGLCCSTTECCHLTYSVVSCTHFVKFLCDFFTLASYGTPATHLSYPQTSRSSAFAPAQPTSPKRRSPSGDELAPEVKKMKLEKTSPVSEKRESRKAKRQSPTTFRGIVSFYAESKCFKFHNSFGVT